MPRQSGPKPKCYVQIVDPKQDEDLVPICGTISKPFKSFQNRNRRSQLFCQAGIGILTLLRPRSDPNSCLLNSADAEQDKNRPKTLSTIARDCRDRAGQQLCGVPERARDPQTSCVLG